MVLVAVDVGEEGGKVGGGDVRVPGKVEEALARFKCAIFPGNMVAKGAVVSMMGLSAASWPRREDEMAGDNQMGGLRNNGRGGM